MNTKNTTTKMALLIAAVVAGGWAQQNPGLWISSYWDGCKPTCAWFNNLSPESKHGITRACYVDNSEIPLGDINETKCFEMGGEAFTCWDQIPFTDPDDPNLAYGFGATREAACGQCFKVTFTGKYPSHKEMPMHDSLAGKSVILMGRNTGGDVNPDQIDFLIPGGGLGMYDCFYPQMGLPKYNLEPLASEAVLGKKDGGLLAECIDSAQQHFNGDWWTHADSVFNYVQACHRRGCERAFGDKPLLYEGCMFHVEWMRSAPNPIATVEILPECPQKLIDRYMPKSIKYTVVRKAIESTSRTGDGSVNESNKTLGGINSSTVLTFDDINVSIAGEYTMDFSIQTAMNTTIFVTINGQPVGTLSDVNPNDWDTYNKVTLGNTVTLNEGRNTVVLTFETHGVNFDYFSLTGDDEVKKQAVGSDVSVKHRTATRAKAPAHRVSIRAVSGGFTASLPAGHGYTSYKLINLQGREIRRGKIGAGANELRITNVGKGVVFLRLEGNGKTPMVVRATSVR